MDNNGDSDALEGSPEARQAPEAESTVSHWQSFSGEHWAKDRGVSYY